MIVIGLTAFLASTPGRAVIPTVITTIAGQLFDITSDYPGEDHPGEETTIYSEIMTLDEALAAFPHELNLPTGIPSDYVLDEENVRVYVGEEAEPFANTIELKWRSEDGWYGYELSITDRWQEGEIIAPDASEEIQLDGGHPAVLIRGGWWADQKAWDYDLGLRLRWVIGELRYDLQHGSDQEEMIAIANSTLE
jgi:hypothetical protein